MELEKEWYIQAPWGKICILAWGDCYDPPVLLCHGSVDSAASFRPLLKLLPKKFYYIGMELPGNGRSDPFPPGLMLGCYDLVYAVEAVVKHFRWKQFVFIGHSLGAVIGKLYQIACPGVMSKLIELDPINFFAVPPEDFERWYKYFFTQYYENYDKFNMPKELTTKHTWQESIESLMKKRGLTEDLAAATLERWSEPAGDGLIRYTFDKRNKLIHSPPFSPEHIKNLFTKVPTQILTIVCEDSLKKSLYRNTVFLLDEKIYPARNYRMRQVTGNHDVHILHPERIASFISQFLIYGVEGLDGKAKL